MGRAITTSPLSISSSGSPPPRHTRPQRLPLPSQPTHRFPLEADVYDDPRECPASNGTSELSSRPGRVPVMRLVVHAIRGRAQHELDGDTSQASQSTPKTRSSPCYRETVKTPTARTDEDTHPEASRRRS
ncbi:hypothetical protein OH77DRAFT_846355 [Trametes cingulata]|nr:hypothetical protein OH77DRAFT_846355 [Trametes cingulata]